MVPKKLVVLDFDEPRLLENKIFNPAEAIKVSHTILPTCYLQRQAALLGIAMVTPDVYLRGRPLPALMLSHLHTSWTKRLIGAGARPIILTCQESPFIATRFYANLKNYSGLYKHSFVFAGMRKRLSSKTQYRQMFFPQAYNPAVIAEVPFGQRKFLTMISGNKRMGNWKKTLLIKFMYGWGIKEIYSLRQRVINLMATRGGFDLYGVGWDRGGLNPGDTSNIKKVYRGKVDDKTETLRQYKFAFCFENSVFPGYVTEKIFDVMFAGCVPVYNGAPDIKNFVPAGAFIDVRDFSGLDRLAEFLENMDESVYNRYMANIKKYLASPEFLKFSQENFAENILGILEQEFNNE
ncbi:MAG: glycosyltransferase family 10 [Candidatus Doudnabacteria bacterium]|nr:glycosyltransferase family 10 [Candidatus Doudnabacteria bacterium]